MINAEETFRTRFEFMLYNSELVLLSTKLIDTRFQSSCKSQKFAKLTFWSMWTTTIASTSTEAKWKGGLTLKCFLN